jgi:hypothetical protein
MADRDPIAEALRDLEKKEAVDEAGQIQVEIKAEEDALTADERALVTVERDFWKYKIRKIDADCIRQLEAACGETLSMGTSGGSGAEAQVSGDIGGIASLSFRLDLLYPRGKNFSGPVASVRLPPGLSHLLFKNCTLPPNIIRLKLPKSLTHLSFEGSNIRNLEGLELPQGLEELDLSGTPLAQDRPMRSALFERLKISHPNLRVVFKAPLP